MSALDLGQRLLGEIEEERLDELLSSLRASNGLQSPAIVGIPVIDALLAAFTGTPYGAVSSVQPTSHATGHGHGTARKQAQPFIEITSPSVGDGKEHLLYYMCTIAVLSSHLDAVPLYGQASAIAIMDADGRFSIPRFAAVVKNYILRRISAACSSTQDAVPRPSMSDVEDAISTALHHIHLFKPQSLASLTTTINGLTRYLFDRKAHASASRRLHSIVLPDVTSFYWTDRSETDTAALPSGGPNSGEGTFVNKTVQDQAQSGYVSLLSSLRKASLALHSPVIYICNSLAGGPDSKAAAHTFRRLPSSMRVQLPGTWQHAPTLRLIIARRGVRKFAPGLSAEEALRDQQERLKAVERSVFDVGVNEWRSEEWNQEIRDRLQAIRGGGFEMKISSSGVEIAGKE